MRGLRWGRLLIEDDKYFTTLAFVEIDENGERKFSLTKRRKVGMTVKSSCPFMTWATHVLQLALNKEKQDREVEQNSETTSQFGLQAATRLHEVGIASNRGSACHGEYVPGPCTHRPSHP